MLRVLHLTDPHLFADPDGALRGTVTCASLASVLDHYRDGDWRADLLLVSGDIIQDDSRTAYQNFRKLLEPVGLPVYCLPGNHDVRALMREELSAPPFHYCETIERGNWLIACLDSCVDGAAGGAVTAAELRKLEASVATSAADNVLVCLHHPPVPMASLWLDSVGLENREEFMQHMQQLGDRVRMLVSGHVHQDYDADHDGIRVITTPSTCRQFARHSREFAVNDKPPAYRRFDLHADGRFRQDLVWVH